VCVYLVSVCARACVCVCVCVCVWVRERERERASARECVSVSVCLSFVRLCVCPLRHKECNVLPVVPPIFFENRKKKFKKVTGIL